jgi:hypothetical protein
MSFSYIELKTAIQQYTDNDEITFTQNIPLFIRIAEERILKGVQLNLFSKTQDANLISGNPYLNVPADFLSPFSLSFGANPFPNGSILDPSTGLPYNEYNLTVGILSAAVDLPPYVAQFITAEATAGRSLGDIDNSGLVNSQDSLLIDRYIKWKWAGLARDATLTDVIVTYIENVFLPYLAANSETYSIYYRPLGTPTETIYLDFKDISFLRSFTQDVSRVGIPRYYAQFDNNNFILSPPPNNNIKVQLTYFYRPASLTAGTDTSYTWLSQNAPMSMLYASLIEAGVFMKSEQDVMQMYTSRYQESLQGIKQLGEAKQTTDEYRMGQLIRGRQ